MLRLLFLITLTLATGFSRRFGGHSYPKTTGYSGYGKTSNAKGSHTYPVSTGLSGKTNVNHYGGTRTNVHNHYHYHPPQQISYPSAHGQMHYPVYHGQPPVYIYEYRNSGSRFDTLLTGLALYNLGTMASHSHGSSYHNNYRSSPNEICKLGVRRENGDYEESRISCQLITAFIWEEESKQNSVRNTITTTNVSSVTSVSNNSVTITNTTTVVNALESKGPSIKVTPGMHCYLIRTSPSNNMKKTVPCGVLQTYAERSLINSAACACSSSIVMLVAVVLCTRAR